MTGEQFDRTMLGYLTELVDFAKDAHKGYFRMVTSDGMDSEAGMIDFTERVFEDIPRKLKHIEFWWERAKEIEPVKEQEE